MTVKKSPPTDLPIHAFQTASALEQFLEREHLTNQTGVYIKFAKKTSGIPSVTPAEAVEIALCFGWIDGRANGINDEWWMVRYTPRRPKSIWSRKNVDTVTRFLSEESTGDNTIRRKMRPAGLAAVEAAKKDGRWDRAYAGPATITVPEDFRLALEEAEEPTARVFFDSLNKSDRYSVLWRIETASPKARAGRIQALVQMLAAGRKPADAGCTESIKAIGAIAKPDHAGKAKRKGLSGKVSKPAILAKNNAPVSKVKSKTTAIIPLSNSIAPRRAGLRSWP